MIFWKMGCLVATSNSVKLKSISSWPKIISSWPKMRAKTTENHFCFHFHFKWLLALENRREREREREGERKKRSRYHRHCTDRDRANVSIAIAWSANCADRDRADRNLTDRDLAFVCPDLMIFFFFFGFCLCFEEWMILYIRLVIEKMWENVSNK